MHSQINNNLHVKLNSGVSIASSDRLGSTIDN